MNESSPPEATVETSTVPLILRVRGEQLAQPIDRAMTTVGSGQSCTFRLAREGVRPLHCLITRNADRLTIRRWSDGTLLNGHEFTEATLAVGDRLTVGPVELELSGESAEDLNPTEDQQLSTVEPAAWGEESPPESTGGLATAFSPASATPDGHHEVPRVPRSNSRATHLKQRARTLVRELRRARQESDRVVAEKLLLESRVEQLAAQTALDEQARVQLQEQLAASKAKLGATQDLATSLREAQEGHREALDTRVAELEQQLAERDGLIQDLRAELVRQQEELDCVVTALEAAQTDPPVGVQEDTHRAAGEAVAPVTAEEGGVQQQPDLSSAEQQEAESAEDAQADWQPSALAHNQDAGPDIHDRDQSPNENAWDVELDGATDAFTSPSHLDAASAESQNSDDGDRIQSDEEALWDRINALRATALSQTHASLESEQLGTGNDNPFTPADETCDVVTSDRDHAAGSHVASAATSEESFIDDSGSAVTDLLGAPEAEGVAADTTFQPTSFLEQYRYQADEDPIEAGGDADSCGLHTDGDRTATAENAITSPVDADSDESIEEYMAQMMARLRDRSGAEPAPTPVPKAPKTSAASDTKPLTDHTNADGGASEATSKETDLPPLTELGTPMSEKTPEHETDMGALRDLANDSARQAIRVAHSRDAREKAFVNLIASSFAGGIGGYMVWISEGTLGWPLLGGSASVAATIYLVYRSVQALSDPYEPPTSAAESEENQESNVESAATEATASDEASLEEPKQAEADTPVMSLDDSEDTTEDESTWDAELLSEATR